MKDLEQPIVSAPNCESADEIKVGGQAYREETFSTNDRLNSYDDNRANTSQIEKQIDNANKGSKEYGKFACVEELLKAYNSLQAEFTRKCQALNAKDSNATAPRPLEVLNGIKQAVEDYASTRPLAKKYATEITDLMLAEESPTSETSINKAYMAVLEKHFIEPENLVKDEEFLSNYIYSDNALCDQIVSKYLDKVTSRTTVPLVAKSSKSSVSLRHINIPRTVYEAGEMAKKIIHKK